MNVSKRCRKRDLAGLEKNRLTLLSDVTQSGPMRTPIDSASTVTGTLQEVDLDWSPSEEEHRVSMHREWDRERVPDLILCHREHILLGNLRSALPSCLPRHPRLSSV